MTGLFQRTGTRSDEVVIGPMHRRHLRKVLAIEDQVYPRPWTQGVFVAELDQVRGGSRHYLVAHVGRTLVGYAGLLFPEPGRDSGGEAHVTNVAVDPTRWGGGIGAALLVELCREALRRGCAAMSLEVRATNERAQALYRRAGFVPVGVRRRYYENTDDAIVMWCHDLDSPVQAERLARLEQR